MIMLILMLMLILRLILILMLLLLLMLMLMLLLLLLLLFLMLLVLLFLLLLLLVPMMIMLIVNASVWPFPLSASLPACLMSVSPVGKLCAVGGSDGSNHLSSAECFDQGSAQCWLHAALATRLCCCSRLLPVAVVVGLFVR